MSLRCAVAITSSSLFSAQKAVQLEIEPNQVKYYLLLSIPWMYENLMPSYMKYKFIPLLGLQKKLDKQIIWILYRFRTKVHTLIYGKIEKNKQTYVMMSVFCYLNNVIMAIQTEQFRMKKWL